MATKLFYFSYFKGAQGLAGDVGRQGEDGKKVNCLVMNIYIQ